MKIKKTIQIKTIKEYILDDIEAKEIRTCLDYCFHRMTKHYSCGLPINLEELNRLRRELRK